MCSIPNTIQFGCFFVNCKKIRTQLMNKKQQLTDIGTHIRFNFWKNMLPGFIVFRMLLLLLLLLMMMMRERKEKNCYDDHDDSSL
jgi:hypothetical protein